MTEIGNRIYPLGRDQRPECVCVRMCVCVSGEKRVGAVHVDLLLVDREVWQLGLLMRGRALYEWAERRPLGIGVLAMFMRPGNLTGLCWAHSQRDMAPPVFNWQLFPASHFFWGGGFAGSESESRFSEPRFLWPFSQAACSWLYLRYHRLQLHCLKLTDSQWYLCLCASVYLDSFVFDEAQRHTHARINTPRHTGLIVPHTYAAVQACAHTRTHTYIPCHLL